MDLKAFFSKIKTDPDLTWDEILLNGTDRKLYSEEFPKGIEDNKIYNFLIEDFSTQKVCPYCKTFLYHIDRDIDDNDDFIPTNIRVRLWYCFKCGFWKMNWFEKRFDMDLSNKTTTLRQQIALFCISKIKSFYEELPDEIDNELASFIMRNPDYWHSISPLKLEKLVASIFKNNYKDCDVIHVGKPFDGGVDVIYIDDNEKQWLIQVKRRIQRRSEGVETLRNMLGTLILNDSLNGIIVSTVDHFTYMAQKEARNALKYGYTVDLIDKGKLNRMVGNLISYEDWLFLMKEMWNPEVDNIEKDFKKHLYLNKYQLKLPFNFE